MGAGSDCYNEYTAFHLFEEYLEVPDVTMFFISFQMLPQQELEDVVALMRSALLVKHWVLMIVQFAALIINFTESMQ